MDHINYYNFDIKYANHILAYTDCFKEIMEDDRNRKELLIRNKYKLEKEGTLIRYKKI